MEIGFDGNLIIDDGKIFQDFPVKKSTKQDMLDLLKELFQNLAHLVGKLVGNLGNKIELLKEILVAFLKGVQSVLTIAQEQ